MMFGRSHPQGDSASYSDFMTWHRVATGGERLAQCRKNTALNLDRGRVEEDPDLSDKLPRSHLKRSMAHFSRLLHPLIMIEAGIGSCSSSVMCADRGKKLR